MPREFAPRMPVRDVAARGFSGTAAPIPHIERLQPVFGDHDLRAIRSYSDQSAQRASNAIDAAAYTMDTRVAFREPSPNLRTAAHEAAHAVQQSSGIQLFGGVGRDGDRFELQAEAVADAVVSGRSAAPLLAEYAPLRTRGTLPAAGVQRTRTPGRKKHAGQPFQPRESKPRAELKRTSRDRLVEHRSKRGRGGFDADNMQVILRQFGPAIPEEDIEGENEQPQMSYFEMADRVMRAEAATRELARELPDTLELEGYFDEIAAYFGLTSIEYEGLGTPQARIVGKINPTFEIRLGAGGIPIEMRTQGNSGGTFQTQANFWGQYLKLPSDGSTHLVGHRMHAMPLSSDHPAGSDAGADKLQEKWMDKLPALNNRVATGSGTKNNYFIRGHLLNHKVGGPALEANLFPITAKANSQHDTFVEAYIKNAIDAGYVYDYQVEVTNVTAGTTPVGAQTLNYVDCDFEINYARLDASLKPMANTQHKTKIESRYGVNGSEPYADKATEYKFDFTGGKAAKPLAIPGQGILKVPSKKPVTSNAGIFGAVPLFTFPSVADTFGWSAKKKKLSLRQSAPADVINFYKTLSWPDPPLTNWLNDVRTNKLSTWAAVKNAAMTVGGLSLADANTIFDPTKPYMKDITINGKP